MISGVGIVAFEAVVFDVSLEFDLAGVEEVHGSGVSRREGGRFIDACVIGVFDEFERRMEKGGVHELLDIDSEFAEVLEHEAALPCFLGEEFLNRCEFNRTEARRF